MNHLYNFQIQPQRQPQLQSHHDKSGASPYLLQLQTSFGTLLHDAEQRVRHQVEQLQERYSMELNAILDEWVEEQSKGDGLIGEMERLEQLEQLERLERLRG